MNEAFIQVTVRLLVGLICAAIGGFFGALVVAMLLSSADFPEWIGSVVRLSFVAVCAALGSRVGWFGTAETRRQSLTLLVFCVASGVLSSWLALAVAGALFDHTDVYILNRDVSGAGFFGAVFGCNLPSAIFAAMLARRGEI